MAIIILLVILAVVVLFAVTHTIKPAVKVFKQGNVCVTGLRGRGKDMLMANVIARRKEDYISNIDYACFNLSHIPLDLKKLDLSSNSYKDFINGTVKKYEYPYPENRDLYISDVGVYFPAQYCNQLNRDFEHFPYFMALSRQIADANVHINVQNLNRAWDKIREQSDMYIYCRWCFVIPVLNIVIQKATFYDKYQSCLDRVKPYSVRMPIGIGKSQAKTMAQISKDQYAQTYGYVKNHIMIYRNKSHYDTRYFKSLLEA